MPDTVRAFVVLHRTAAGYLAVGSDYDTRQEAEEDAADRASVRGRVHWVAEVVSEARRGEPVVSRKETAG